jgi:hypothetical protein
MATFTLNQSSGPFGTQLIVTGMNIPIDPATFYPSINFNGPTINPNYKYDPPNVDLVVTGSSPSFNATWTFIVNDSPVVNMGSNPPPLGSYIVYVRPTGAGGFLNTLKTFEIIAEPICFNANTKISCLKNNTETNIEVQNLKKGDLVKTVRNGYLPVNAVGKSICYNPKNNERTKSRMYRLKKEKYSELKEDLIITGCHSILVSSLTDEKYDEIKIKNGRIYVTDGMYRLPTYLDDKSDIYADEYGDISVYHVALGEDENRNYGIYANGLLVESCFIPKVKNQMEVIS